MPLHVMGEMQTDSKHHQHFWVPVGNCLDFRISQNKQARLVSLCMAGLHFILLFSIYLLFFFHFWRVTCLKSPRGERLRFVPACLGCFHTRWCDAALILHSHPAKSWILTRAPVIFECCWFVVLYWRVICQFHYKPHLQLSCFKSNQTVSWHVHQVRWDVGLALLGGPIPQTSSFLSKSTGWKINPNYFQFYFFFPKCLVWKI